MLYEVITGNLSAVIKITADIFRGSDDGNQRNPWNDFDYFFAIEAVKEIVNTKSQTDHFNPSGRVILLFV